MVYLAHHGVKGQKWGDRNGPPYPLDAEDHSASEKKAGWKKSLDKSKKFSRKEYRREEDRLYNEKEAELSTKYKLDELQKKAIDYGSKHNLDLDDGGGGSEAHGKKYLELWDKYDEAEAKVREETKAYVHEQLLNKYGDKTVKQMRTRSNIAAGMALVGASIVSIGSLSVGAYLVGQGAKALGRGAVKGAKAIGRGVDKVISKADTAEKFKSLMNPHFGDRPKSGAMPFYLRDR